MKNDTKKNDDQTQEILDLRNQEMAEDLGSPMLQREIHQVEESRPYSIKSFFSIIERASFISKYDIFEFPIASNLSFTGRSAVTPPENSS